QARRALRVSQGRARPLPRAAAVDPRAKRRARAAALPRARRLHHRDGDGRADDRRGYRGGPEGRRGIPGRPSRVIGRFTLLGLILAAQTPANIGPLGIPAIAKLIREDLGLTLAQAGSFLSAYYVGPILMSMPAGTMADHWGIKRTLVLGQIVIASGLLAVSAASSYPTLIVLMSVAGFGYGMLNPTS